MCRRFKMDDYDSNETEELLGTELETHLHSTIVSLIFFFVFFFISIILLLLFRLFLFDKFDFENTYDID